MPPVLYNIFYRIHLWYFDDVPHVISDISWTLEIGTDGLVDMVILFPSHGRFICKLETD
jgi:hypothetical protein